jgi:hypothetical protein
MSARTHLKVLKCEPTGTFVVRGLLGLEIDINVAEKDFGLLLDSILLLCMASAVLNLPKSAGIQDDCSALSRG